MDMFQARHYLPSAFLTGRLLLLTNSGTQRIKGAIDRSIAEEQSKHKAALANQKLPAPTSTGPTSAARRSRSSSGTKTQSPARRPRRKPGEESSSKEINGDSPANPDPAVFEAAFVIDDTDEFATPARAATPSSSGKELENSSTQTTDVEASGRSGNTASQNGDEDGATKGAVDPQETVPPTAAPKSAELSPEVSTRLKKLEKLEKTYPGTSSNTQPSS
jgi:hypothetical protein